MKRQHTLDLDKIKFKIKVVNNLAVLLFLQSIHGLGLRTLNKIVNKLQQENLEIKNIFDLDFNILLKLGLTHQQIQSIKKPNWDYSNKQQELAQKKNIDLITIYDNYYPEKLKQIYDPPVVLYIMGDKKIISAEQIAIVGTRHPTIYGKKTAEYFSREISSHGFLVTSGYALGIDIAAHLAALELNMPTIAVLGTSLDYIYPARHQKYVENILDSGGVFISEFGFTTPPQPSCFPRRNRIISGLSRGVLVVEAARQSGSLITARIAMEQNREVFVVPGNINNKQALGCLDLISDGAKLVIDINDILTELSGFAIAAPKLGLGQKQKQVMTSKPDNKLDNNLDQHFQQLLAAISGSTTDFDTIIDNSRMPAEQVSSMLVQLEIMGYIQPVSGGYVKIV